MATPSFDIRLNPGSVGTRRGTVLYQMIMPLLAGGAMLGASLLPWLVDPLGTAFPAWQLPVDIGWQLRSGIFSYGLLCLCCALYAFFVAYRAWEEMHSTLAGFFCMVPVGLFFMQYLFVDMGSIAQLARHEFQAFFIQNHFGYHVAAQLIPIQPDTFDPSTLNGRFALLLDQVQPGLCLPFLAAFCLVSGRGRRHQLGQQRWLWAIIVGFVLLLVVLGRGPAALVCRFQAEQLLTTGDYADALVWLDHARMLNPSLEQLPEYHVERGQAWYYLHPTQPSMDSQVYLAAFYLRQDDYLSAYQKLMAARQQNVGTSVSSWLIDELSIALTRLAEMPHPLNGPPVPRVNKDRPSIIWLDTLLHVDPGNVYAHYTLGRIEYDMHDFTACEKQMLAVIDLSSNPDILSSVYTYLSLSSEAEGNYVQARDYLFEAQALDPSYRNNTAREEMSGLH